MMNDDTAAVKSTGLGEPEFSLGMRFGLSQGFLSANLAIHENNTSKCQGDKISKFMAILYIYLRQNYIHYIL